MPGGLDMVSTQGSAIASARLTGEPVRATSTAAPGNGAPNGGANVVGESGWFAARPSGIEKPARLYPLVGAAQNMVNETPGPLGSV